MGGGEDASAAASSTNAAFPGWTHTHTAAAAAAAVAAASLAAMRVAEDPARKSMRVRPALRKTTRIDRRRRRRSPLRRHREGFARGSGSFR